MNSLKIQGFGFPFTVEHSSCSTIPPKNFSWSNDKQNIQVYIDGSIISGLTTPKHENKYAWICESRFMSPKRIRETFTLKASNYLSPASAPRYHSPRRTTPIPW